MSANAPGIEIVRPVLNYTEEDLMYLEGALVGVTGFSRLRSEVGIVTLTGLKAVLVESRQIEALQLALGIEADENHQAELTQFIGENALDSQLSEPVDAKTFPAVSIHKQQGDFYERTLVVGRRGRGVNMAREHNFFKVLLKDFYRIKDDPPEVWKGTFAARGVRLAEAYSIDGFGILKGLEKEMHTSHDILPESTNYGAAVALPAREQDFRRIEIPAGVY